MKLIAKRAKGYVFLAIGLAAILVEVLFFANEDNIILLPFLLITGIIFGSLFIYEIVSPKELISIDESEGSIYLHQDDEWIKPSSLKTVSFERAFSKHRKSTCGKIVIETQLGKFEYPNVEDVETVAQELKKLIVTEEIKSE